MNRKKFIGIFGGTMIAVDATSYLLSDKSNLVRADIKPADDKNKTLKPNVMKNDFRERSIDRIKQEVSASAGWILITSKGNSVATLLETGRRMQRLFLTVRERSIAIHPMTQILGEVGWEYPEGTQLYFKGKLTEINYEFAL